MYVISVSFAELLNLTPLPISALNDPRLESLYKFTHFNPVQTQIFHPVYHTDCNVLLGAPTGSGKTLAAEMAIFRVFREYPGNKVCSCISVTTSNSPCTCYLLATGCHFQCVYIAPLKALVRERMEDWKVRIEQKLGKKLVNILPYPFSVLNPFDCLYALILQHIHIYS